MLGTILAAAVATKVVKEVGKAAASAAGAAVVASAAGAAVAGAAAVAGVAGAAAANGKKVKISKQEEQARLDRERREYWDSIHRQNEVRENARREAEARRQRELDTVLRQLYAKFAICYYIALADGVLVNEERAELDRLCLDIYNKFPNPTVQKELLKIYNTPNMNFIVLEKYIQGVDHTVIASFLTLADETAALDGNTTDAEKQSIYKLRKYLK